jgi:hypothetical protein
MKMAKNYGTTEGFAAQKGGRPSYPRAGVQDQIGRVPVVSQRHARRVASVAHKLRTRGRRGASDAKDVNAHRLILALLGAASATLARLAGSRKRRIHGFAAAECANSGVEAAGGQGPGSPFQGMDRRCPCQQQQQQEPGRRGGTGPPAA